VTIRVEKKSSSDGKGQRGKVALIPLFFSGGGSFFLIYVASEGKERRGEYIKPEGTR